MEDAYQWANDAVQSAVAALPEGAGIVAASAVAGATLLPVTGALIGTLVPFTVNSVIASTKTSDNVAVDYTSATAAIEKAKWIAATLTSVGAVVAGGAVGAAGAIAWDDSDLVGRTYKWVETVEVTQAVGVEETEAPSPVPVTAPVKEEPTILEQVYRWVGYEPETPGTASPSPVVTVTKEEGLFDHVYSWFASPEPTPAPTQPQGVLDQVYQWVGIQQPVATPPPQPQGLVDRVYEWLGYPAPVPSKTSPVSTFLAPVYDFFGLEHSTPTQQPSTTAELDGAPSWSVSSWFGSS